MPAKKDTVEKSKYIVISRTGTNPLSVAVENAMKEGYTPIGGVTISSDLKGRERITTYHQSMALLE